MLLVDDFNHIKLLYEKLLKLNLHIKNLAENAQWEALNNAVQDKGNLIQQIISFEKPRLKDIKENDELNAMRLNLIELEKNNLDIITSTKEKLVGELGNVKRAKKVLNAYEPSSNEGVSTFEISADN